MNAFRTLTVVAGLLAANFVQASVIHVEDTYFGNNATRHYNFNGKDYIGSDFFSISSADLSFTGNLLTLSINTKYDARQTNKTLGTTWGDLFLDTPGGKTWDYVVDTSSSKIFGGNFKTYKSNDLISSRYTFRDNETVAYKSKGTFIEGATVDLSHAGSFISYTFDYTKLGLAAGDKFGFRWAETCGNDIIQAQVTIPAAPVPEPETYALLGLGLAAIAVARRRRS